MHRRVLIISAAACPVLLAACGGIPSSGGPFDAGEAGSEEAFPQVVRDLQPATEDMTADEIVGGFLDAMEIWEPPSGYPTAATFLTERAQAQWEDPLSEIIVYEGDATTEIELGEDTGTATLALDVEATYDRVDGFVRRPDDAEPTTYSFPLERVGGEWRLAEPPNGLLIETESFDRYFSPHNLYFFNKGFDTTLVPDPVYLPTTANQQTLLVQELLEGPSEWLAPAVATAFPAGTSLEPAAVAITGGDAMVTLSAQAVTRSDGTVTSPERRARMVTQLVATLGELRTVRRVQVAAGTATLSGTDENPYLAVPTSSGATGLATRLYTVTEFGVSWVADGASPAVTPVSGPLGGRSDIREVAIDRSNTTAAAVTTDNQLVTAGLSGDSEVTPLVEGAVSLGSLAWDGNDLLWSIERPQAEPGGEEPGNGGGEGAGGAESGDTSGTDEDATGDSGNRLLVMDPGTGEYEDVTPQMPDGVDVERFAISPDGTRIALLAGGAVFLAIVERNPETPQDPSTIGISGMRELNFENLLTPVGGVAWYDSDELALLTEPDDPAAEGIDPDSGQAKSSEPPTPEVRLARIDELAARDDGPVPNGVSLAAPAVDDRLAVGTSENEVWIRSKLGRWTLLEGATAPAYAG